MSFPRPIWRISSYAVFLFSLIFSACDLQRAPEKETATQPEKSAATPAPRNAATAKTWSDIPVSNPENRITIHYHRHDENYDVINLWTWDNYQKNTPKQ